MDVAAPPGERQDEPIEVQLVLKQTRPGMSKISMELLRDGQKVASCDIQADGVYAGVISPRLTGQLACGRYVLRPSANDCVSYELAIEIVSLTRLLLEPDMEPAVRKAIIRQLSDVEARRDRLHNASAALLDRADEAVGRIRDAVRRAFREAKESVENVATPLELHEFVEEFAGPITLQRDGTVVPGCKSGPRYVGTTCMGS